VKQSVVQEAPPAPGNAKLSKTGVAVEKGTKAVILVHFSVSGQPTFNNLQRTFLAKTL
jgi:hypothetical protein